MHALRIFLLMALAALPTRAVAADDEAVTLLAKAKTAIGRFLPGADLFYVDGRKSTVAGCEGRFDWKYVFQTVDPSLFDGHAVAGSVQFGTRLMASGDCVTTERVVVDTAMAPVLGYVPLARHGDLDLVHLGWADALAAATAQLPDFQWQGAFEIYTPVYPGAMSHVYYVLFGAQGVKAYVEASTGEVGSGH